MANRRTGKNTLFGMNGNTPAPVINEENVNMEAVITETPVTEVAPVNPSIRTWAERSALPARLSYTQEQIDAMSVRAHFEELLTLGMIGLTRTTQGSRKAGVPVVYQNNIQMDQIARALAYHSEGIHRAFAAELSADVRILNLLDLEGDQDRAVVGRRNEIDKQVYYTAHYASKQFNDFGQLIGLTTGNAHPVNVAIEKRTNDWNEYTDKFNAALKAVARGEASDDQKQLVSKRDFTGLNENQIVQYHRLTHINVNSIVNKYQLEAWLLLGRTLPAFEIFTRAKDAEGVQKFLDLVITKMDKAYRSELAKLSGLVTFGKVDDAE